VSRYTYRTLHVCILHKKPTKAQFIDIIYYHCVSLTYFSPQRAIYSEYDIYISEARSKEWVNQSVVLPQDGPFEDWSVSEWHSVNKVVLIINVRIFAFLCEIVIFMYRHDLPGLMWSKLWCLLSWGDEICIRNGPTHAFDRSYLLLTV